MAEYQVSLDGYVDRNLTDDDLAALADALEANAGAVSGRGPDLGVTLSIVAPDTVSAVKEATTVAGKVVKSAGIDVRRWRGIEALETAEAERRLAEPTIPPLVGAVEAAEILEVARQRVHQLAAENSSFPKPVVQTASGSLWTRASIEAFARSWTRKPGRPPKPAAGVYRCQGCGLDMVSLDGTLVPCTNCGSERWLPTSATVPDEAGQAQAPAPRARGRRITGSGR